MSLLASENPAVRMQLFGFPQVFIDGALVEFSTRRVLALLIAMTILPARQSRSALAALVFPDPSESNSRANLRRALSQIKGQFPDIFDTPDRELVITHSEHWQIDARVFSEGAQQDDLDTLLRCAALYQDTFLAGFTLPYAPAFYEWQWRESERLRALYSRILDKLSGQYAAHDDRDNALRWSLRWAQHDPLHEPAQYRLLQAYMVNGQRAAALQQVEQYARLLKTQLNVDPGDDIQRLVDRLKHADVSPTPSHPVQAQTVLPTNQGNPYRGLLPFAAEDSALFFGREDLCAQLIESLTTDRFIVLTGASGSGKTSLLHAGILAHYRRVGQIVAEFTPRDHPLEQFDAALTRAELPPAADLITRVSADLIVLIDQFEEVFTLTEDEDERRRFLALLSASRARCLIALRADFLDQALAYEGFNTLVQSHTRFILPLTAAELHRAITLPAQQVGVQVESALAAALIADVQQQPGALPFLQYTLTELYETAADGQLRLSDYQRFHGVFAPLSNRAEHIYMQLPPVQQLLTRRLFLRLVTVDERQVTTRRRASLAELAAFGDSATTVLNEFGQARLLTFDTDPTTLTPLVDIAHEALITAWDRLHGWVADSSVDLQHERQLTAAARQWDEHGRSADDLLRGAALARFEDWQRTTDFALSERERTFLHMGRLEHLREQAAEEARRQHELALERQANLRQRAIMLLLVMIALVGSAFALVLLYQNTLIEQERDAAQRSADQSQSLALAVNARRAAETDNTDLALALAVQAASIPNPPAEAYRTLQEIAYQPGTVHRFQPPSGGELASVAISPNGRFVLAGAGRSTLDQPRTADNDVYLWDVITRALIGQFAGHEDGVIAGVFSPDGTRAATASLDGTLIVWDVPEQRLLQRIRLVAEDQQLGQVSVAFLPDGRRLFTTVGLETAQSYLIQWEVDLIAPVLWDAETGAPLGTITFTEPPTTILSARVVGENAYLNSWTAYDNPESDAQPDRRAMTRWELVRIDLRSLSETARVTIPQGYPSVQPLMTVLAISPDETHAVAIKGSVLEADVSVINLGSNEVERRFPFIMTNQTVNTGHSYLNHVLDAVLIDNRTLLTSSDDNTIIVWNIDFALPLRHFTGHTDSVTALAQGVDRGTLFSASRDGSLRQWRLDSYGQIRVLTEHNGRDQGAVFSPDGRYVLNTQSDQNNLFNFDSFIVRYWDAETGELIWHLPGLRFAALSGPHISRDGRWGYAGAGYGLRSQGQIVVWDLLTGELIHNLQLDASNSVVVGLEMLSSQDGFAISSVDGSVRTVDLATGAVRREFVDGHPSETHWGEIALDPSGTLIAYVSASAETSVAEVDSGTVIARLPTAAKAFEFSPDGQTLAIIDTDNTFSLWDYRSGTLAQRFIGHQDRVIAVDFTSDGQQILSSSFDGTAILWDAATGQAVRTFVASFGWALSADVNPDGRSALVSYNDDRIIIWDLTTPPVDELLRWTRENRYVPPWSEELCRQYATSSVQVSFSNNSN